MSQAALAERVGLSRTSVTNIEKGRQRIPFDVLFSLADALKVDAKSLVPASNPATPPDLEEKLPKDEAERRAVQQVVSKADH